MNIINLTDRFAILDAKDRPPPKPHFYKLRKALMLSNNISCKKCGNTSDLEAHHINKTKYLKTTKGHSYQDPQDDHTTNNGILLCRSCHRNLHSKKH